MESLGADLADGPEEAISDFVPDLDVVDRDTLVVERCDKVEGITVQ